MGPDIMTSSFMHGVSISDVRYCLQTHSHSDHFDPSHLVTRIPEYASENVPLLKLYASDACLRNMSVLLKKEWEGAGLLDANEREHLNIEIRVVGSLETFDAGPYTITAFASDHDKSDHSLIYSITEKDRTVFYGTDTGTLSEDVWRGFHDKALKFDVAILDHTYGTVPGGNDHLNADQFIAHVNRMRDENLLSENARIFATHISHEGNPNHNEFAEIAKEHHYEAAYDGLVIDI
jgi:phosphoribosyl 1,2-cyclic phosphate phosphodiesterase